MADIWHEFGNPLQLSASGDVLTADAGLYTQQRVIRRLLTAPGATPWHPPYGAGLPAMVGNPANALRIAGTTRRQMALEKRVGQRPPPIVTLDVQPTGTVTATISYADAITGTTGTVNF